ncbi:hypothetical protein PIB30_024767 [Stylosanthes scabra]|uniref:Remorin C-terminal domain-containing protein n=1 Tax=Stylosanthes scabra TaxID=79078 RepID=A0ABU6U8Q7_9FABA|nr:hypothetical protein [Stylosanthes scabra]
MENFFNQVRTKFPGVEENQDVHGGSRDQKIQTQKTESFKEKKRGQNWLQKIGRKTSRDFDTEEHAAAVAAAAFAIDSKEDLEHKSEASLTKTKSKVEGIKSTISLLGSASKRHSGSFRSKDEEGEKVPLSSVTEEKKPEKEITHAPSMKKSSSFPDEKPKTSAAEVPAPPIRRQSSAKPAPVRQASPVARTATETQTGSGIGDSKAIEWEKTELEKIRERYEKLKRTIDDWENKKKVKAKRKLNKEESELERRRFKVLENFNTDMKYIDTVANGARAKADKIRQNEELKAQEKANEIRKTGKLPGICSCF